MKKKKTMISVNEFCKLKGIAPYKMKGISKKLLNSPAIPISILKALIMDTPDAPTRGRSWLDENQDEKSFPA